MAADRKCRRLALTIEMHEVGPDPIAQSMHRVQVAVRRLG